MGLISTRARMLRSFNITSRSPVRRWKVSGSTRLPWPLLVAASDTSSVGSIASEDEVWTGCAASGFAPAFSFLLHEEKVTNSAETSPTQAIRRTAYPDRSITPPLIAVKLEEKARTIHHASTHRFLCKWLMPYLPFRACLPARPETACIP